MSRAGLLRKLTMQIDLLRRTQTLRPTMTRTLRELGYEIRVKA